MKNLLTAKNIFILIGAIYLITVIERKLLKEDDQTEIMIEHAQEKAQMQSEINVLNNKVHSYEIEIIKNNATVDTLSDAQLDSVWTDLFSTR